MSADHIDIRLPRGVAQSIAENWRGALDPDVDFLIERIWEALRDEGGAVGAEQDIGELYQREDGRWGWRRKARNGDVVATDGGQGYENQRDARHMAESRNPGIVFEEQTREETEGGTTGDH